MKSLIRSPFFERVFDLDRFFNDDWFYRSGLGLSKTNGQVNITEGKENYTIEVSAPGFAKDELNIRINDGILTVSGEHKDEKNESNDNYTRREFSKSSFERSFTIPDDVDNDSGFDATFENGILKVVVNKPKELPKTEPKQIQIK